MTVGGYGYNHPFLLGRTAQARYHPTATITRQLEGEASQGTVLTATFNAWVAGTYPTNEVGDIAILVTQEVRRSTSRVLAMQGYHEYRGGPRDVSVIFRVRHYPYDTPDHNALIGQSGTLTTPFPLWLLDKWLTGSPIAMAFCDTAEDICLGVVGNWIITSMIKLEPLRGIQQWDIRLIQRDYAAYRQIDWEP